MGRQFDGGSAAGGNPIGMSSLVPLSDVSLFEVSAKATDNALKNSSCGVRSLACVGDHVVSASSHPALKLWKVSESALVEEKQVLRRTSVGNACVESSGDAHTLAACTDDGAIIIWDLRESRAVGLFDAPLGSAWRLKYMPDGNRLIAGGPCGLVSSWDLRRMADGRLKRDALLKETSLPRAKTSEEGEADPADGETRPKKKVRNDPSVVRAPVVQSLAISDNSKYIACGLSSGTIGILSESLDWFGEVPAHSGQYGRVPVRATAFQSGSEMLISGGDDYHVAVIDTARWSKEYFSTTAAQHVERFAAHRNWVTSALFCPTASHVLVTTSWDDTVKMWDVEKRGLLKTFKEHADSVWCAAFAQNGKFFVTGGADSQVVLYRSSVEREEAVE